MIAPLLMLLAAPGQVASQRPQTPPQAGPTVAAEPYDGKFMVVYSPIYCIRAPCPPGRYSIKLPDRPAISVTSVDYDPATPATARGATRGAGTWPDGLAVDGQVTFVRAANGRMTAVILARRTVAGLWKP